MDDKLSYLPIIRNLTDKLSNVKSGIAFLKELLDFYNVRYTVVDNDYNIIYANHVIRETYGDEYNCKCYKYFHKSEEPCSKGNERGECVLIEALNDKEIKFGTRNINGEEFLICFIPIKNNGDKFVLEIFLDITNSKSKERICNCIKQCDNLLSE